MKPLSTSSLTLKSSISMFSRQQDAPKQSFLSCKGAASLVANHDSDIYTVSSGKAFPFLLEWSGTFQSDNISLFVRENKPGDEAEAEYKKKRKCKSKVNKYILQKQTDTTMHLCKSLTHKQPYKRCCIFPLLTF